MENGFGEAERLERRFDAAMEDVYHAAARLGYRPTRFLEMIREHGGVATAHQLLAADKIHDGLAELFLLGRLDLTVEHHVLLPKYEAPFSDDEQAHGPGSRLARARSRPRCACNDHPR